MRPRSQLPTNMIWKRSFSINEHATAMMAHFLVMTGQSHNPHVKDFAGRLGGRAQFRMDSNMEGGAARRSMRRGEGWRPW